MQQFSQYFLQINLRAFVIKGIQNLLGMRTAVCIKSIKTRLIISLNFPCESRFSWNVTLAGRISVQEKKKYLPLDLSNVCSCVPTFFSSSLFFSLLTSLIWFEENVDSKYLGNISWLIGKDYVIFMVELEAISWNATKRKQFLFDLCALHIANKLCFFLNFS